MATTSRPNPTAADLPPYSSGMTPLRPRVVSLLPGATEMIAALGAVDLLVGVSHECDEPAAVRHLPRVTTTPVDSSAPSAAIHAAVRAAVASGQQAIGIDAVLLSALDPDVIVTQRLCEVCAVAEGEAIGLAEVMDPPPRVVALHGRTLEGVWDDLVILGRAIGRAEEGERLAEALRAEVAALAAEHRREVPPRVVAIEWLDPLFLAGHWVPEMIAAAGGIDVGASPGSHSTLRDWNDVMALDPDLVLVILCGFDEMRARAELAAMPDGVPKRWLAEQRVAVHDGNAYTSRPGPRLVEGIRRIAAALPALALLLLLACTAPDPVVEGIRGNETVAGSIHLRAAWGLQPFTNAPLPGYLRIVNLGTTADTLLDVRSDVAGGVRLHGSEGGGGGMTMLTHVVIAPADSVVMAPGGMHLMLEQLRQRVVAGDTVAVVLRFAQAGEVTLRLPVVGYEKLELLK